jgi:hypothetical protein
MVRRMGLLAFLLLLLAGCTGEAGPASRWLLRAAFGETVALPGSSLAITFDGIPLDSRCPADVDCGWSGEVTVDLTVDDDANPPQRVAFTVLTDARGMVTGSAPEAVSETVYGPYRIVLRKVDPYPADLDAPVAAEDLGITREVGPLETATPEIVTTDDVPPAVVTPTPGSRSGSPPPPRGTPTPVAGNACPDPTVLPVLCINYRILVEKTAGATEEEPVQLGAETDVCALTSQADGDAICAALGDGWQMADADMLDPSSAWREYLVADRPAWSWDWETGMPVRE